MSTSAQSPDAGRRLLAGAVLVLAVAIVAGVYIYRSTSPFNQCVAAAQAQTGESELASIGRCRNLAR